MERPGGSQIVTRAEKKLKGPWHWLWSSRQLLRGS